MRLPVPQVDRDRLDPVVREVLDGGWLSPAVWWHFAAMLHALDSPSFGVREMVRLLFEKTDQLDEDTVLAVRFESAYGIVPDWRHRMRLTVAVADALLEAQDSREEERLQ